MKHKLFIFLALLLPVFLFSSTAETQKSKDETKMDATSEEVNQVDDAKYGCRYRCCGHYGCRCCSYAEAQAQAQLTGAQANNAKVEVAQEVNQVDDAKYYGCKYRCCGHYGCRCCTFADIMAEELNNQENEVKNLENGYGGRGGYGGGRGGGGGYGGGYGGGRGGGGGGHGGYGGGRGGGGGGANP